MTKLSMQFHLKSDHSLKIRYPDAGLFKRSSKNGTGRFYESLKFIEWHSMRWYKKIEKSGS